MGIHILLGSNAPSKLLWHVQAMAHAVTEVAEGRCRRAIVTVPPRHLKSTVATVEHIAWRLGQDPTLKILLVSYSKALSKELLGKVRTLMAHPWYRATFPCVAETLRINRADLVQTAAGGQVTATSFSAGFTGMGADLIIVDDPLRAQSSFSETQRERCIRTFDEGLRSRLERSGAWRDRGGDATPARGGPGWSPPRGGRLAGVAVAARGRGRAGRAALRRSRRASPGRDNPRPGPRAAGDRRKRSVGPWARSSTARNTSRSRSLPRAPCSGWATWSRYDKPRRDYDELVIAVDTAMETGEANDYTACVVLGRYGHRIHVLRVERDRIAVYRAAHDGA